jgi:hypothetical protein
MRRRETDLLFSSVMGFPFGFAFEFHALDLTTPEKHLVEFS